jgi:hypothetical protein
MEKNSNNLPKITKNLLPTSFDTKMVPQNWLFFCRGRIYLQATLWLFGE